MVETNTDGYNPFAKHESDMKKYSKMSLEEAKELIGNAARWELLNMKKALSSMVILNSSEENTRLVAVKKLLKL